MGKVTKANELKNIDLASKKKEKSRNRPKIPDAVVCKLWSKAGGRCELCNEPLYRDGLTFHTVKQSHMAHILSWTPNGPRYVKGRSEKLATDFSNLMLVCMKHNALFDVGAAVGEFTEEALLKIKQEHEDRIYAATAIKPENQTTPLIYASNVGKYKVDIDEKEIRTALFPNFYPKTDETISIKLQLFDTERKFWEIERQNLERYYFDYIERQREQGKIRHISVFAFAPQPLLIYLGYLLTDKYCTEIYPLHRNPKSWSWKEDTSDVEFIISKPTNFSKTPVLTLSLSCEITEGRVKEAINEPYSRWDISIETPNPECISNKNTLYRFSLEIYKILDEIKNRHGQEKTLHVIPVMPIAAAVEFGRKINNKYTMPVSLYNHNEEIGKFEPVLDIGASSIKKEGEWVNV